MILGCHLCMQRFWRRNLRLGTEGSSLASLLFSRLCVPLLPKSIHLFSLLARHRHLVLHSLYSKLVCFSKLPVANTLLCSLALLPSLAMVAGSALHGVPCLSLLEWGGWGGHAVLIGKQISDFVPAYVLWHFWRFLKCKMFQRKQQLGFYWKINYVGTFPFAVGFCQRTKLLTLGGKDEMVKGQL